MSKLWAVVGSQNNHGGGALIAASPRTVFINNIAVIEHGDPAAPDGLCRATPVHCTPFTSSGSGSVYVYGSPVHRHGDGRICGATTIVSQQSTVFSG